VPWFKVDDQLHDHRKARVAGAHAMGMWVLAGSWCGANPNDGFIPESVVVRWEPRAYRKLARALVDAGLWHVDELNGEHGWRFHDWADFQPTRAEIDAERAAARDRMRTRRANLKNVNGSPGVRANTDLNDDGTTDEGSPAVPGSRPVPARTGPSRRGRTPSATTSRPDPWCPRHPGGTDEPCRACGVAAKAALAWSPPTPMPPTVAELREQGVIR
jgi:hypothetical protein